MNQSIWPNGDHTSELLSEARGGDADAVDELLDRHRESLRRMIDLRLDQRIKRRVDVSDVVQDVLVEASRRLKDYLAKSIDGLSFWIRQIAKDRIIDATDSSRFSQAKCRSRTTARRAGAVDQSTMDLAGQLCDHELTPPPQQRSVNWPSMCKARSSSWMSAIETSF